MKGEDEEVEKDFLIIGRSVEGTLECRVGESFGDCAWQPSDEFIEAIEKELELHSKIEEDEKDCQPFVELAKVVESVLDEFKASKRWTKKFEEFESEEFGSEG
ncbi:hypothetical protein DRO19_00665 [Candidatus Bathyarchaeota archaeon]|nr:MAG: hypothetical protein DRO19_00665 [Candidatus Bathyarchaeota archaeon]